MRTSSTITAFLLMNHRPEKDGTFVLDEKEKSVMA